MGFLFLFNCGLTLPNAIQLRYDSVIKLQLGFDMANNNGWNDVLHTVPKATVVTHRRVVDVMAARVEKASIRLATVSDWFEVADNIA